MNPRHIRRRTMERLPWLRTLCRVCHRLGPRQLCPGCLALIRLEAIEQQAVTQGATR